MSTTNKQENEKIAIGNQGAASDTDESLTNPTHIDEKKLLRKLDLRLLPPLTLLYLLSFLDRSNSMPSFSLLILLMCHTDEEQLAMQS